MNAKCKRFIDIVIAVIGLLLAAPLMGIIFVLIKLDSSGDVIFAQERLGLHGKPFRLYKFRKFPSDWRNAGPSVTMADDVRMTRIGRILERTKLDELPQLWNVLKGDMSFVGPRPESIRFSHLFTDKYTAVLEHPPGIFGPTQFALTDESELYPTDEDPEIFYSRVLFPKKAEIDLAYQERANCIKDIGWILAGIGVTIINSVNWKEFSEIYKFVIIDAILIIGSWFLANLLRFSGLPPGEADFNAFIAGLWIFPCFLTGAFIIRGCYRSPTWCFYLVDAIRLIRVMSVAWLLSYLLVLQYANRYASFYLIPMGWFILLSVLVSTRIWFRLKAEKLYTSISPKQSYQIVIYGAGRGGIALANWMKSKPLGLNLVGFVDDNPKLRGKIILGYPILGRERDIPTIQARYHFDEIWIAFQPEELKRIRLNKVCKQQHIKLIVLTDFEPFSIRSIRLPESDNQIPTSLGRRELV